MNISSNSQIFFHTSDYFLEINEEMKGCPATPHLPGPQCAGDMHLLPFQHTDRGIVAPYVCWCVCFLCLLVWSFRSLPTIENWDVCKNTSIFLFMNLKKGSYLKKCRLEKVHEFPKSSQIQKKIQNSTTFHEFKNISLILKIPWILKFMDLNRTSSRI